MGCLAYFYFMGNYMRILYLGDIVGEEALGAIEKNLERIKKENRINIVLANAENLAGGRGLTQELYKRLMKAGISAVSMGNHTYSKRQITDFIETSNIVRPANLYKVPGKECLEINFNSQKITLINVLGRVFMNGSSDCPFRTMDRLLETNESDYVIVDIHAEATSEKIALARYLDGRVTAVVGTHTHVQTADNQCLPAGTLYISDLGMCGPVDSVLGDEVEPIIERFITGVYKPLKPATGKIMLNGAILDLKSKEIKRFHEEL